MKILLTVIVIAITMSNGFAQKSLDYENYIDSELVDYSLLLKYRDSIGLTKTQLANIKDFYEKSPFDVKQKLDDYQKALRNLKNAIDEGKSEDYTIGVFNQVLDAEKDIKLNRLKFILHSKEVLTDVQRKKLRVIGRSNKLTSKISSGLFLSDTDLVIKPIYKIVNSDKGEFYITEDVVKDIDYDQVDRVEVDKGIDVTIDDINYPNRNLITLTMKKPIQESKIGYFKVKSSGKISSEPLFIIEHKSKVYKFKGSDNTLLSEIDPDDIESINVIKGASTIQYGKDGEDGVIIIKLKDKAEYQIK